MNLNSALQQARRSFQNSRYNIPAQLKAIPELIGLKMEQRGRPPISLPAPRQKDPWAEKGWTRAGEGYYQKKDKGGYSFIDKDKIPASTMARLQPTPTSTPAVAAQVAQPLDTTGLSYADFKKIAMPIFDKYEIPHAVGFGQFAAEGRLDHMGAARNNFYNIGAYDSNPDLAMYYDTPEAGIEAYAKLMSGQFKKESGELDERFLPAYKYRSKPKKMIREIQNLGYAGDPATYTERAKNNYNTYSDFVMDTPEWREFY